MVWQALTVFPTVTLCKQPMLHLVAMVALPQLLSQQPYHTCTDWIRFPMLQCTFNFLETSRQY